jgi:hypothetical protein
VNGQLAVTTDLAHLPHLQEGDIFHDIEGIYGPKGELYRIGQCPPRHAEGSGVSITAKAKKKGKPQE